MRLIVFFILIINWGCVGTIESSKTPTSDNLSPVSGVLNFSGVQRVVAISDTRVEVYFPKATGGSGKYVYEVYVGTDRVETYPDEVLQLDSGFYQVMIKNLSIFSTVAIRVEARDAVLDAKSNNNKIENATTFSTEVCRFDGIVSVSNIPGESGKDSLKIKWVPAQMVSLGHEANPITYEVVLVKQGKSDGTGTAIEKDQMDSTNEGRYVYTIPWSDNLNEYIVRGLTADYKYLVRVRCIHQDSKTNLFYPQLRSELNNVTVQHATLNDDLSNLSTAGIGLSATNLPGQSGLMGVRVSWSEVQGAFDHFRVYFSQTTSAPQITPECDPANCKKETYSSLNSIITGLQALTSYNLRLVICGSISCTTSFLTDPISIKTEPNIAVFNGIREITMNYDPSEIGSVNLKFLLPDFTTGYGEKYQVEVKIGDGVYSKIEDQLDVFLNENYDINTATSLRVSGIELGNTEKYCFKIKLKIGASTDTNTALSCLDVSTTSTESKFIAPSKEDFAGLIGTDFNNYLIVRWKKPLSGFYSHYKLYISTVSDFAADKTTVENLDRFPFESQLSSEKTFMEKFYSIDQNKTYYIKMKTSFPNPYVAGDFLSEENNCSWMCKLTNNQFGCTPQSNSCPVMNQ